MSVTRVTDLNSADLRYLKLETDQPQAPPRAQDDFPQRLREVPSRPAWRLEFDEREYRGQVTRGQSQRRDCLHAEGREL